MKDYGLNKDFGNASYTIIHVVILQFEILKNIVCHFFQKLIVIFLFKNQTILFNFNYGS